MSRIFSSRKGQALEALENALGRCEREGIKIKTDSGADNFTTGVVIFIPGTHWDGDSILLDDEEFPKV